GDRRTVRDASAFLAHRRARARNRLAARPSSSRNSATAGGACATPGGASTQERACARLRRFPYEFLHGVVLVLFPADRYRTARPEDDRVSHHPAPPAAGLPRDHV